MHKLYIKDNYLFIAPSVVGNKKYSVFDLKGNYITSFGGMYKDGTPYEQYFDKITHYKKYNHGDIERKKRYYKRHGITKDKTSAKYFSNKYLW